MERKKRVRIESALLIIVGVVLAIYPVLGGVFDTTYAFLIPIGIVFVFYGGYYLRKSYESETA